MISNTTTTTVSARIEHGNYLGATRLALSLLVCYSHSFPLSGDPHEPIARLTQYLSSLGKIGLMISNINSFGAIAVDTFFVISGFLITQSWLNSKSAEEFIIKRISRIYPGYWVAFVFSLLVGLIFSRPASVGYLKHVFPHHDAVLTGLIFITYGALDSDFAFGSNPFPRIVNGSIWTLQPELVCYLLILILGSFALLKRSRGVVIAFVVVLFGLGANAIAYHDTTHTLWRFLFDFLAGTMVFLYGDSLSARPRMIIGALLALMASILIPILYPVLYPICCGYLLFSLGFRRPPAILRWKADLSYGVYIYAFPVQQACVASLHLPPSAILLTTISAPIVLVLAWLSWSYVEQPAIERFRGRYIRLRQPKSEHSTA